MAKRNPENKDAHAYEKQRNARLVLVLLGLVTLVNLILQWVSVSLVFPCSFYFTRFLMTVEGFPRAGALAICLVLCFILFLFQTAAGNRQFAKMRVMRSAMILYSADSLFYFGMNLTGVTANKGQLSFIIELVFRLYCVYALFEADRLHGDPTRYDKPDPEAQNEKSRPAPSRETKGEDEENDEGIQW